MSTLHLRPRVQPGDQFKSQTPVTAPFVEPDPVVFPPEPRHRDVEQPRKQRRHGSDEKRFKKYSKQNLTREYR